MTATTPKRRVDFTVHPAHITFSIGALLRIAALVLLLGFSSIAVAAAPEGSPESSPAASATPAATPSAAMPRLELDLDELNDSGISGTVTLYEADDQTIVEFDIKGAGGDHPAHIHAGVCGDLEPEPAFNLDNIDKDGKSTTVVKTSLDDLLAKDYAVDVHLAPNELGTLIACADIDGQPELPENATPAASPQSTPSAGVGGQTTTTPTETATATTGSDGTAGANATEPVATETQAPVTETTPAPTTTPQATASESTMTRGQGDISDGTGGPGSAVPLPSVPTTTTPGDGTAGVSGKGEPVATTSLPQQTGVGAALAWPDNPVTAMIWASSVAAMVLGTSAWIIRRGERTTMTTNSRWTRMGI